MTVRESPSNKRYLEMGCTITRTEIGRKMHSHLTRIHYYGPCRVCGQEMRDVDDHGYEDCSRSPQHLLTYGPVDPTICTSCALHAYMTARDLTGRTAVCPQCRKEVPSGWHLAFFQYNETRQDTFYCGCRGWD